MTRKLDHLVLPVADLSVARQRLSSLGFTVAPDGQHPFGTANCCAYFSDGSFIEPLAIVDPARAADAIRSGNVFVARDHVFRSMIGEQGVSAIALTTDDAAHDDWRFKEKGIDLGDVLTFSRPFIDASGNGDTATFRLAFAGLPDIADAFVFTCERVNAPKVDRSAFVTHANGVLSISRVLVDPDAAAYLGLIAPASEAARGRAIVQLGETIVSVSSEFDGDVARTISAVAFQVSDLHIVENLLKGAAINFFQRQSVRIVVPPAPGQGVHFIFEASL